MELNEEKIIKQGVEHFYKKGDIIFKQGEPGNVMYLILEGEVMLTADHGGGKPVTLTVLKKGDSLGEMSLLENMPRSATATAVKDTKLVSFTKEQLLDYVSNEKGFAWNLLTKLSGRIREQNRRLAETVSVELQSVSEQLNERMKSMEEKIAEVASFANEIEENERKLVARIKEVEEITNEVNRILAFITQIANQTRILGFNATIEAARSGEHGQGFKIVAKEMTKLSELSRENANNIKNLSKQISDRMKIVSEASEENAKKSIQQTQITAEMVENSKEVMKLSSILVKISSSLKE